MTQVFYQIWMWKVWAVSERGISFVSPHYATLSQLVKRESQKPFSHKNAIISMSKSFTFPLHVVISFNHLTISLSLKLFFFQVTKTPNTIQNCSSLLLVSNFQTLCPHLHLIPKHIPFLFSSLNICIWQWQTRATRAILISSRMKRCKWTFNATSLGEPLPEEGVFI